MINESENMLTWILAVRIFSSDNWNHAWNFKWNDGLFAEVKVETFDEGKLLYLKDDVEQSIVGWCR